MKAIYVESMGDNTAAIYVHDGKVWRLSAIINPDDPGALLWPANAVSDEEMSRWCDNCVTHGVRVVNLPRRSREDGR